MNEIRTVVLVTLYFAAWLGVLLVLKKLILAEYRIAFHGMSMALIGALVLAKVVLVLEHVQMGPWVRSKPVLLNIALRTALYASGVIVVLLLERGFDGYREHGGFGLSLAAVFQHPDIHHVWANAICISGALLGFNILSVVQRQLGEGGLSRLLLSPYSEELDEKRPTEEHHEQDAGN